MARLNTARARTTVRTHQSAPASPNVKPIDQLRRTVLSCMLWEDTFYENGESIADRITALVPKCDGQDVECLAVQARGEYRMRHAPLWLAQALATTGYPTATLLANVIQRPDELTEVLAQYWKDGKRPLPAQMKKGLALAFRKFDAYQLAKWDRGNIKLRDVMFLVHPKPVDEKQANVWKHLADGTLKPADTWEKRLSGGESKQKAFGELLAENKLGHMALLRNLRNMEGVDDGLIRRRIVGGARKSKALPFRYIAAAKHAPRFEDALDRAMQMTMAEMPKLDGKTAVVVDVSGSMSAPLSGKSQMTRIEAATGLAILLAGVCENARMFSFSEKVVEMAPRACLALHDAIIMSQPNYGTRMGAAVERVKTLDKFDRIVVLTDEQSFDPVGPPGSAKGYILNVGSYENGVGYGPWTHINGFSEASVRFIRELES